MVHISLVIFFCEIVLFLYSCSICICKQNYHFIVPKSNFRLIKGENVITTYTFNTHKAKHTFCSICGVQSFYFPRSNPDGVGVMPHCISGDIMDNQIKDQLVSS